MMDFVAWVEESALGIYMLDSIWGYPIVLSAHAVGMAIVVGTVLMIDLRLVGFVGRAPLDSFKNIFFVTWIGVALNLLSGIALFASDPEKFTFHYVFWIKIGLMLAGVFSVFLLWSQVHRDGAGGEADFEPSPRLKMLAWFSMLLWFLVILTGRLVGYIEMA